MAFLCLLFQLIVVDAARFAVHAVGNEVIGAAREVHGAAVGQMTTVGQIHAHHGVAVLDEGKVGGHIGLAARMRLHVGVVAVEQRHGAVAGEVFHHVHELAAAVVPLARIAFGILVRHDGALRFAHGGRYKVFRSDEFKLAHLATGFLPDGGRDFGVAQNQFVHGSPFLKIEGRSPGPAD